MMKQLRLNRIGTGLLLILLAWGIYLAPVAAAPPAQGGDPQAQALALFNEGKALGEAGQYEAALPKLEAALSLYRTIGDRFGEAISLLLIGFYKEELPDYTGALDAYQASLPIWREIGDQTYEEAILYFIGGVYYNLGQYDQALNYYQQDLAVVRETGDPAGEGLVLNNIGGVFDELGQYEQALDTYRQALAIHRETHNREPEGVTLNNIGEVYYGLGEYRQALEYYQQALAIRQELGDQAREGTALNNIGTVYDTLGRFETALDYYQQALTVWQEASDRAGEGLALNNIGEVYANLRQDEVALDYYRQSLVIRQERGDRVGEGVTLNNIAGVHKRLGQYEQALAGYQQVLAIFQDMGDQTRTGLTLNNLGIVYDDLGQSEQALDYYQQALAILRETGNRAEARVALENIGFFYQNAGDSAQATSFYQQAIEIIESIQGNLTIEELKASFAGDPRQTTVYQQLISLLWAGGRFEEAFNYVERARARAFLDQVAGGAVDFRAGASAELLEREQTLKAEISARRAQLATLHSRSGDERDPAAIATVQAELTVLEEEYAALLIELKIQSPEYASLVSVDVASLAEVQSLLDPDVTLVEYFVTEERTLAALITHNSFKTVTLNASREDLAQAITVFRDFANLDTLHPASLQQLRAWLIEPLKPHLNTPALGIIPHNILHYLPFAALTDGERYLGDDYVLFTLPSASVLRFIQEKRKPSPNTVLALGNPTIAEPLPLLRYARQEAETIAGLYGGQALLGSEATEGAIWSRAGETGILHLAAHGTYNSHNPLFSTIHLAGDDQNDGRLEVHEIYNLDLTQKTDLVVLSACETAVGELSAGDGVVGLNRVFLYAGTPSVIASLWNVEDEATSLLMERFYTHLRDGMGKAEALRQAQLEVREQYPNPYYWSAFVLSGDGGEVGEVVPGSKDAEEQEEASTPVASETTPTEAALEEATAPQGEVVETGATGGCLGLMLSLVMLAGGVVIIRQRRN